jgi:hypothetical protein
MTGVLIILGCISGVYGSNAGGNGGGAAGATAVGSGAAVVGTVASPRSARGNGAAGVGQDGTHYTFALSSGDNMILDGITRETKVAMLLINADTTVGDLFKQLYEKAKSEYERTKLPHYDWSGPEIIRITAEDGKIVHELHQDQYGKHLAVVFKGNIDLTIIPEQV